LTSGGLSEKDTYIVWCGNM